jgi:hypothetical protein
VAWRGIVLIVADLPYLRLRFNHFRPGLNPLAVNVLPFRYEMGHWIFNNRVDMLSQSGNMEGQAPQREGERQTDHARTIWLNHLGVKSGKQ